MEALLAHCTAAFSQHGGIFTVFFLGGMMGSITHCLAMCGPMVACQAACADKCSKHISTSSQWSYHTGRLLTYGALGFFSALLSKQIAAQPIWPYISSAMLVLAGSLFMISALPSVKHHLFSFSIKGNFIRGALMGFMPCGLLYAALMMAATLADPVAGMFAMWIFVLGTVPALLAASVGTHIITQKWQHVMNGIGRVVMAFNGLSLLVMAARIMR
jgi:sulfite exporter TauE/SafE